MTTAPPITWPLPTSFKPRPYQLDGVRRAVEQHLVYDCALGSGKSTMSLATIEALGCRRVLVLAPVRVLVVWRDEVNENAARTWTTWSGEVRGASGKRLSNPSVTKRVEAIQTAMAGAQRLRRPFMAAVNYESTHQGVMSEYLLGVQWDALICDEAHHLAGSASASSRYTAKLARGVRGNGGRIILCTGTFFPHSPLSAFGQMRTLDPSVLGTSWTSFKARYAKWRVLRETAWCPGCKREANLAFVGKPCNRPRTIIGGGVDTPGCGAIVEPGEPVYHRTPRGDLIPDGVREDRREELMERLAPWVHRVSQEELDAQTGLVEAVPQLRTCPLDPTARKAYDTLKRELIARVADGTIVASNAMVNVGKLMMVTSGHYRDEGSGEMRTLHDGDLCAKAKLLYGELAEDEDAEPVVVFYSYRYDATQIRLVCEKLGRRYGELSGDRNDLDGKFMPDVEVFAVQWQAGSEGLNFSRARHEIDYSLTFNLTRFTQAPRRLNRQGQTRHVTRRVLACEDTIDYACFHKLKRRELDNRAVLALLGDR